MAIIVRFKCSRTASYIPPFGVPELGIDGQFTAELRPAAVHCDTSHDVTVQPFFTT